MNRVFKSAALMMGLAIALPAAAQTRPAGGGSWTAVPGGYAVPAAVFDQGAGGNVLHLWEDGGARITSLIYGSATGQLLGVCEATAFPDGTMLAEVSALAYSGTVLVGVTQLT